MLWGTGTPHVKKGSSPNWWPYLVAFGLAGDGWSNQHEPMADHRGLVQLDTLLDEPVNVLQSFADGCLMNALL